MSWNGTVTCSHCWERGHNKRGCPKLKAEIAERREDNPEDWRVQMYDQRRKSTSRKGEKRSCTYCGEQGHNRRTCAILKTHVAALQKAGVEWRRNVVSALESASLGVGSILVEERWSSKTRYLVTGIRWEGATYLSKGRTILRVRDLAQLTKGESGCNLPVMEVLERSSTYVNENLSVLAAKDDISVPAGWVEEGMSVKEAKEELKERESWMFERRFPEAASYL